MKIEYDKIFLRLLFFFSGFLSIFIVVIEFFNIGVFGDLLLIYITMGFFMQMSTFFYDRMIIKKKSTYSLLLICCILLVYAFYLILIIFTVISLNNILAIFELLFLMISIGFIKVLISFKKKNNYMFCRILLRIEFLITLSLSSIIFILNFFERSSLIFLISLCLLLGGFSNILYGFIWKLKNN